MKKTSLLALVMAAIVALVSLAGCGDSNQKREEEFIKRHNARQEKMNESTEKLKNL